MGHQNSLLAGQTKKSRAYREAIMVEYNWCCAVCGSADRDNLQIDHVVAKTNGGGDELENLQVLCAVCNSQIKSSIDTPRMPPRKPNRDSLKAFRNISKKRQAFRAEINGLRQEKREQGYIQKQGKWQKSHTK
jgi:5-methylcytosine-specific restriction endonuclease McrA